MNSSSNKTSIIFAIVGAVVIISAQFIYFGFRLLDDNKMSDDQLQAKIDAGIEAYVEKKIQEQNGTQPTGNIADTVPLDLDLNALADDDAVLGDKNAPVTMIEFSDYECPFCFRYFADSYPKIIEKYVDTGKVKIIFRDYPLNFHPDSFPSALAGECVRDQGDDATYFEMHDKMFNDQSNLNKETFLTYVKELGLDETKFSDCFDSQKFSDEIYADLADGQAAGIKGTPGFFINGKLVSGAQPYEVFEAAIEEQLQ